MIFKNAIIKINKNVMSKFRAVYLVLVSHIDNTLILMMF